MASGVDAHHAWNGPPSVSVFIHMDSPHSFGELEALWERERERERMLQKLLFAPTLRAHKAVLENATRGGIVVLH